MIAGKLSEHIEIYSPNVVRNEFGEQHIEYILKNETKANKVNLRGSRTVENNEVVYNYVKLFEVRIYVDVNEFDRIKYDSKFYRILNIDKDKELQKITIECELVNE